MVLFLALRSGQNEWCERQDQRLMTSLGAFCKTGEQTC